MSSKRSISFRHRYDADEIYTLPVRLRPATLNVDVASVLVEHRDDGSVLVVAGNLPGADWYFDNSNESEEAEREAGSDQDFSVELVKRAQEHLAEYDPETSYSKTNSGNRHMKDVYVTVDESERDAAVVDMWSMLNELKDRYVERLRESEDHDFVEYEPLEREVLEVSKRVPDVVAP